MDGDGGDYAIILSYCSSSSHSYLKVLHDPATLDGADGHEHGVEVLLGHGLRQVVHDEVGAAAVAARL